MQENIIEFWIDHNLPPIMAIWLQELFDVKAISFKELSLSSEKDFFIFNLAKKTKASVIITTKDIDFKNLQNQAVIVPKILYLNVGNISNKQLKELIVKVFPEIIYQFKYTSKQFIEITKQHL